MKTVVGAALGVVFGVSLVRVAVNRIRGSWQSRRARTDRDR